MTSLRIAVNAHLLAHTHTFRRAGVSYHIEQVLNHLGQLDSISQYDIYTTRGLDAAALGLPPNFAVLPSRLHTINPRLRIPWEQFIAPWLLRRTGASLYHGMLNVVPLNCPVPSVVTVHDIAFIRYPHTFRAHNRTYLDFATRTSVRRADRICAVSEHTKHELVGLMGVPPERVVITPNAARSIFRPIAASELEQFRIGQGLPEQFILYLGTLEPRKNLTTLLEAYYQLAQHTSAPLIIGGGRGWLYGPVFERLEALNLQDRVKFVGYIPGEQLPYWYGAATLFAFPSFYEGFGMPPLEAMACGTPVMTSNTSSLPEVVGDAGLMVPPDDPTAMAAAMQQLLTDAELRAELRERGFKQAERFSWRTTAERLLAVYEDVGRVAPQHV